MFVGKTKTGMACIHEAQTAQGDGEAIGATASRYGDAGTPVEPQGRANMK